MKTHLLMLAFLSVHAYVLSQIPETFTVKAGESIMDVLGPEAIFQYPEFLQGKVMYDDGTYTETLLNYNKVLGEMQFINSRGDSVVIANPEVVHSICFPQDTFYVGEGYLEQISGNDNLSVLVKSYVKLRDVKKQGAYGMSSTGNIDNYTSVSSSTNTGTLQLKSNQDMVYVFETEYYFTDDHEHFVPARRNNLLKLYPDQKNDIKTFIKEESINFNRSQDLVMLVSYVKGLVD